MPTYNPFGGAMPMPNSVSPSYGTPDQGTPIPDRLVRFSGGRMVGGASTPVCTAVIVVVAIAVLGSLHLAGFRSTITVGRGA